MRRRHLLATLGASLALAGCSGDGDSTTEPAPTDTADPTETPADTATPADTETSTDTATPADTEMPTETATPQPEPDQVVTVAPDGRFEFDPESFTVAAGETVQWTLDGSGHNVKPGDIPSGSDWQGTPGGEFDTFGSGYTYQYTFETPGEYAYVCSVHESSGMTASFTVE